MDLLLPKSYAAVVLVLGPLAHKLLSEWRASPQRNEQDVNPQKIAVDDCYDYIFAWDSEEYMNPQRNEEDVNPGTPSPPIPPSDYDCEVFLNFSGRDTRKGFADHLYRSLINAGIRVFGDDVELHAGEEVSPGLRSAIENSKISIPIISENYTSSKYCLDELVAMLNFKRNWGGHIVQPIFYKVNPADVRRQRGSSFGEAFHYHSKHFDPDVVAEWKKALAEVSNLKGWESERVADGDEGQLVELVVRKVLVELKKALEPVITENSVSRTIITAREENILDRAQVDHKHDHKPMEEYEAKILFARHAFQRDSPPSEFSGLSDEVVCALRGFPLTLEIIGSYLCGKDRPSWENTKRTLRRLQRLQNSQEWLERILKIVYYALKVEQRKIFLDIACFLVGSDARIASYMWDTSDLNSTLGIEELISMSLVKVGDNHELIMHDEVRDFGRSIVRGGRCKEPDNGSRLWIHEEAFRMLGGDEGAANTRGLSLDKGSSEITQYTNEQFKNLVSLRFLRISDADFVGDFKEIFSKLRWLQWERCPDNLEEKKFDVGELAVLDLSRSMISDNWSGWKPIMSSAKKLKVLNLTGCDSLVNTFFLSDFKHLEILILRNCKKLKKISSIGELKTLVSLDLRGCRGLEDLPEGVGNLGGLKELFLDQTLIGEIGDIMSLENLQRLSLQKCERVTLGRDLFRKLESLTELVLTDAEITELPESIGDLKNLGVLKIRGTGIVELGDYIGRLGNLRELDASGCIKLKTVTQSICNLSSLQSLNLGNCVELLCLPELPSSLTVVTVTCTSKELPSFCRLTRLKQLRLHNCKSLEHIPELPCSTTLELEISGCESLESLPSFSHLIHLKQLRLHNCKSLDHIPDLPSTTLQLEISGCESLKSLTLPDAVQDFKVSLKRLDIIRRKSSGTMVFSKLNLLQRNRDEEDVNPGTPSPPIPPSDYDCEVFLNFSGRDTRKGFADHLCRSLINAGIRVFGDDVELHAGAEVSRVLRRAIENSKISIPIISENYASSKYCLDELVQMMECKEHSGHIVLPIFYKVNPADVQRQRGSGFGEAFRYHSERFDAEVVAEWKKALAEVSNLKGWESERGVHGREGELIDSIVREVLNELNKAAEFDISKNLVGIDSDVEKVMELIDKSSGATICVGIHGMEGIGKTTLVKVVYDKLFDQFVHRSFIADIKKSCHRNGIVYLQNQLISDIFEMDIQVHDIDEGVKFIASRCKDKKVLIILDDVDAPYQLNALAGNTDWFLPGSRIFVTTRDKSVLDSAGVVAKYELNEMDRELSEEQSLTLFSRHAFRRDSPPNDFLALADVVVSITGGLPLVLEVVGSYLCGKPPKVWIETIEKMQNMPQKAVRDKLMISYYELEEEQRQIFLDIACFLIGSETRVASYMWDACGFFAWVGIEVLRSMSLIKIGDNREFIMHSQLRDLGREIVRAESDDEPHKRSRLWVYEEALEVLEREKGSEMICAVCLEKGNSTGFADEDDFDYQGSRQFTPEQFERLPHLRFLHMSDVSLTGDFKSLLSELRWLKWGNCPSKFEATNLQAEELVILDLSGSKISDDWQGWHSMMVAKELKVLNLTGCRSLKSPSCLLAFKKLEILILRGCSELEGIDPRIGDMENLVSLDLRGCSRLEELPPQMAKLEQLEELLLDRTALQEIPSFISSLKKLKTFSAKDCKFLLGLLDSVGRLVNLRCLDLSGCSSLKELPPKMGELEQLKELLLDQTMIQEIPSSIGSLTKLEKLSARCCVSLARLPDSIGRLMNLGCLDLSRCSSLKELPPQMGELVQLKKLLLDQTMIQEIPSSIGSLTKLEKLSARYCVSLGGLPDSIGDLVNLRCLDLSGSGSLKELPPQKGELAHFKELLPDQTLIREIPSSIGYLKKLDMLSAKDCKFLLGLPDSIGDLMNLRCLDLSGCASLKELPPQMGELEQLKELLLDQTLIREIPSSIGYLKKLEMLSAKDCKFLLGLPDSIGALVNLRCLDLSGCSSLKELPPKMGELEQLKELLLDQIMIQEIPSSIGYLMKLEMLSAKDCVFLLGLPDSIGALVNLRCLDLSGCSSLKELPPQMGELEQLKDLLLDQIMIQEIPSSIGSLTKLEKLSARYCVSLVGLPDSIGRLVNLRCLDLSGCSSLKELPPQMGELEQLKELLLDQTMIQEIPSSIGSLTKLEKLSARYCVSLVGLPDSIGHLVNLSALVLSGCVKLAELPDSIGRLGNLSTLDLSGCVNLFKLPYSIGNLGNLSTLVLSGCVNLEVLLGSIGLLGNLSTLDLSGCVNLLKLPYSIGCLGNLSTLDLSGCIDLAVLPNWIGYLGNLSTLDLSGCVNLFKLPYSIGELGNLSTLVLSGCVELAELPDSIGRLGNLSTLDLSGCVNLAVLPDSIGRLGNLSTLDLSGCVNLLKLPYSIGELGNLSTLVLSGCVELAELPESIGFLGNLQCLSLGRCHQLKTIPNSIGRLKSLTQLDLSWTGIKELPESIRHLQNLEVLDIDHGSITELPDGIGRLKKL